MHEVGAHQPGEGERALNGGPRGLGEAQQQKGDEDDGDLDAHGVLGGTEEAADLQRLLDLAEEQLDLPAAPVEIGDSSAVASRSLRRMRSTLPISILTRAQSALSALSRTPVESIR